MRILQIIAGVDPAHGGPPEALRTVSQALKQLGHETEVVSLDDRDAPYLSGFPFPVHAQGRVIRRYGYTPSLSRWICDNAGCFDVAVINGLWNHASIGGWQGLRKAGLPYCVFPHGMMDPWFRDAYPLKHWAKQAFWLLAQGKVLRDAQCVVFTCEEERILARGSFFGYGYREKVVSYGTATPPDDSAAQRAALHEAAPALKGRRFILFLSRIHPKKGCDLLVKAFSEVAEKYPDVDLVIAGPDQVSLQAQLQDMARKKGCADRIHWPGMLQGDAKWGAFRQAEAFILPSHQENFGIVVAEALGCGTPVLITNKVNIWREVESSGGGMVEPDTIEGVGNLLECWLSLPPREKQEMSENALAGFERYFHVDHAAKKISQVLEDVKKGVLS